VKDDDNDGVDDVDKVLYMRKTHKDHYDGTK